MSKVKSLVAAALTLAVSATVSKAALSVTVTPVVEGVWSVNSDGTIGSLTNTLPNATTVANGTPAYYDVHFLLTVTGATPLTGPAPVITLGGVAFGLDGIGRQPTYLGAGQPTQGLSPVPGATTIGYTDITGLNSTTLSTPAGANGLFEEIVNNGDGTFSSNDFINSATAGSIFTGAAGDQGQHNLLAMAFEIDAGKISNTQKTIGQASAFDLGDAFIYWNGTGQQTLAINDAAGDSSQLQYNTDTFPQATTSSIGVLGPALFTPDLNTVVFGSAVITPEPASLGVLAIGGMALLARRKKA